MVAQFLAPLPFAFFVSTVTGTNVTWAGHAPGRFSEEQYLRKQALVLMMQMMAGNSSANSRVFNEMDF